MSLLEDRRGVIWVGTFGGGLDRHDRATGTFVHYRHDPANAASLSSDSVVSIHEDPDGELWIGTRGGGLNRWSRQDRDAHRGVFIRYSERDGLPNDSIWGILSDDEGNLWLSTNRGISKFNTAAETIRNYNPVHGLQSNEFNFGAHYRSPGGEMFFGGINGFNAFYPERIRDNAHPPPVLLTAFLKANQPVQLDRPIWEIEEIELGYRDYVVSLEFAALDFAAPEQNRFAYRLEGFNDAWIQLGTLPRVTFTSLNAGRYTFKVKASNNDGLWNEEGVSLEVRVIPAPWKTWWAYTLYALMLGSVVLAYVRAQTRKLKREEEYSRKLEEKVRERTRELEEASLTDPLTGLRNRRYLMTHIGEDLALIDRYYERHPEQLGAGGDEHRDFLFLMVDLDGLKKINDLYGHAAGDAALIRMRDLLQSACRKSDALIRLGGDEFLVVGRDVSREAAERVAERVRQTVRHAALELSDGQKLELSCSVGFAFYPFLLSEPTRISGDQVVTIADRALYVAKTSGRNAWVGIYSTDKTVPDDLMEMINYRLEPLIEHGAIDLSASLPVDKLFFDVNGAPLDA
jgi:diguanylate cyclase (GGDEF)-like protein